MSTTKQEQGESIYLTRYRSRSLPDAVSLRYPYLPGETHSSESVSRRGTTGWCRLILRLRISESPSSSCILYSVKIGKTLTMDDSRLAASERSRIPLRRQTIPSTAARIPIPAVHGRVGPVLHCRHVAILNSRQHEYSAAPVCTSLVYGAEVRLGMTKAVMVGDAEKSDGSAWSAAEPPPAADCNVMTSECEVDADADAETELDGGVGDAVAIADPEASKRPITCCADT